MKKNLSSVRKFYLLDYFYVLLRSVEKYSERDQVFGMFKDLKQEFGLGESKYKKISTETSNLSRNQLIKFQYTFEKVVAESVEYDLIVISNGRYLITPIGKKLIELYQDSFETYAITIFRLMESQYEAFRFIIELLQKSNTNRLGLFILPHYSPLQLGFDRSEIKTTKDIKYYSITLVRQLEQDIEKYLGEKRLLNYSNEELLHLLIQENLIPNDDHLDFSPTQYNAIISRFRDYWLKYFLKEIYHYDHHLTSFEIWTYRAKQIGIIHATEFYPFFNGKIVYPTSVVISSTDSHDFIKIFDYSDGFTLQIHKPNIIKNQDRFIEYLVNGYYDLRKTNRSYFISLSALKELVCYNMKISEYVFQEFIDSVYLANLKGELKINISLEVDKLPEETKAAYLYREPVKVGGRYRNIIAIDVTKGGSR